VSDPTAATRYLDTSAIAPMFVPDGHSDAMREWLARKAPPLVISDFGAAEFAAAVGRLLRMGELRAADTNAVLSKFDHWRADQVLVRLTTANDIAACDRLVRDFRLKLGVPDALHLAIAITIDAPLVTFDHRLASAARLVDHPATVPNQAV
jgi:predicted nucleic acid-binding protein